MLLTFQEMKKKTLHTQNEWTSRSHNANAVKCYRIIIYEMACDGSPYAVHIGLWRLFNFNRMGLKNSIWINYHLTATWQADGCLCACDLIIILISLLAFLRHENYDWAWFALYFCCRHLRIFLSLLHLNC